MASESTALLSSSNGNGSSSSFAAKLRTKLKEAAGGDGRVQKSEFQLLLLDLGVRGVRSNVLQDIFAACDVDGDGSLTVDEIVSYMESYTPTTDEASSFSNALSYTFQKATSSVVWWFAVAFHFAAWVGITSFFLTETGGHLAPEWGIVGAWFFFFGAVYFFKLLLDSETAAYDTVHQARVLLKKFFVKDNKNDASFFDRAAGTDGRLDKYELNAVLEEQGVYLPNDALRKIHASIDTDDTGTITKDEMLAFSQTQKWDPLPDERNAAITEAVVHTWGFWSLLCWFVGSILFLVGAHLSYAGYKEPPLPHHTYLHLYGMGSVMYFLLAVCMIPMLQNECETYLESVVRMRRAFRHKRERSGAMSDADFLSSLDAADGNVDGGLDASDLYDVLMEEGVLVPYDTLLELFQAADVSADGKLNGQEFTKFIGSLQVSDDPNKRYWQMIRRAPASSSFFGWLMFFIGGIFYVMGSYLDLTDSVGWYFAGALSYGLASGKSVFGTLRGHYLHYLAVESGKAQFKAKLAGDGVPPIV